MNITKTILKDRYSHLPSAIQDYHDHPNQEWLGKAIIKGDNNWFIRLLRALLGFPAPNPNCPLRVIMKKGAHNEEIWIRDFNGNQFQSHIGVNQSETLMYERILGFKFYFELIPEQDRLIWIFHHATFLKIPLPSFLRPNINAYETIDETDNYAFYVKVSLPILGVLAHYEGAFKQ